MNFLDIKMRFKKEDGKVKIETDLYVKPSNKQLFLDWTSNHLFGSVSELSRDVHREI